MATVSENIQELNEIKQEIKAALIEKGQQVDDKFATYPEAVRTISGGEPAEWKPNPTWWNIETIIKEDPESANFYGPLYIELITADSPTTVLTGAMEYLTSDGAEYKDTTHGTEKFTHTWDESQDKPCDEGYSTRWIIYRFAYSGEDITKEVSNNALYAYFFKHRFNLLFKEKPLLRSFKLGEEVERISSGTVSEFCLNCYSLEALPENLITNRWTTFESFCRGCCSLKSVPLMNTSNGTNFLNFLRECYTLEYLPALDFSNGTNFSYFCAYCYSLKSISNIDTYKGQYFNYFLYYCYSITEIPELVTWMNGKDFSYFCAYCYSLRKMTKLKFSGDVTWGNAFNQCRSLAVIKIDLGGSTWSPSAPFSNTKNVTVLELKRLATNLNVSTMTLLTRDSLVNQLQLLPDRTGKTSLKLTLGAINLAKLTADEKAIATNKNWVLA